MNVEELNKIARKMTAKGKGILAADESTATIQKRFDKIGVTNTEENRRDYREMMFRAEAGMKHVSGVILFDETIRQKAKDGTPLVKIIEQAGAVPGIKVDKGTKPLPASPGDTITEGLDGLRERLVNTTSSAPASPSGARPMIRRKAALATIRSTPMRMRSRVTPHSARRTASSRSSSPKC